MHDQSKSFDLVEHELLLSKLNIYENRGHCIDNYFTSYLSYRKFFVSFNNENSNLCNINVPLPQGNCIGPISFNLYTNDIVLFMNDTNFVIQSVHKVRNYFVDNGNFFLINDLLSYRYMIFNHIFIFGEFKL